MSTNKIITIACIIIAIVCFSLHDIFHFASAVGAAAILPPLMMNVRKKSDNQEVLEFVPFWLVPSNK